MKATGGKANPGVVNQLVTAKLGARRLSVAGSAATEMERQRECVRRPGADRRICRRMIIVDTRARGGV